MNSKWDPEDIAKAVHGKLIQKGSKPCGTVGTDSRENLEGAVFFALKGERFDGHEFAGQAATQGASCLVVDRPIPPVADDVSVIEVQDTLRALQEFACWHRRNWKGKIIAITGSNGKTTTKEFAQTILSQKFPTLASAGNFNNHIGVPLTLLKLELEHKFAVIEMGMNHAGELTTLCEMALPDIVLVTNVGKAHLGNFPNIDGVAQAKEELYEASPKGATRIYNLDNTHTAMMRARAPGGCKVLTYSSYGRDVDVSFKERMLTLEFLEIAGVIGKEPGQVRVPSFGRQHVSNAMAASCIALACGLETKLIWRGLSQCRSAWGRNQIIELESGATAMFDGYNANPDSMQMALDNFERIAARGKKYAVVGEMLELGEFAQDLHFELGSRLARLGVEAVMFIGQHGKQVEAGLRKAGFNKNIVISETYEEKLAIEFGNMLTMGDIVLVKGSRGIRLERVVQSWKPLHFEIKK